MHYYIKKRGGWPRETTYQDYRNAVRRKGSRDIVMLNGGYKVGRIAEVKY